MTAKEYLKQYEREVTRIEQLRDRIEKLHSIATGGAAQYGDMPKTTPQTNRSEQLAVQIADLNKTLERKIVASILLRDKIADSIDRVPDAKHAQLLYDKYISLMRWAEIASEMAYDETYVRGCLHSKALLSYAKMIQNDTNISDKL